MLEDLSKLKQRHLKQVGLTGEWKICASKNRSEPLIVFIHTTTNTELFFTQEEFTAAMEQDSFFLGWLEGEGYKLTNQDIAAGFLAYLNNLPVNETAQQDTNDDVTIEFPTSDLDTCTPKAA